MYGNAVIRIRCLSESNDNHAIKVYSYKFFMTKITYLSFN